MGSVNTLIIMMTIACIALLLHLFAHVFLFLYIYMYVEARIVDAFACQSFVKVVIEVIGFLFESPSSPCLKCRVETDIYKTNHKNHKYCNHAIYVFPQQQLIAAYDIAF